MKKAILIPARLESSRLPRKLLLDLGGRTVLENTYRKAKEAIGFVDVWIVTDSDEIEAKARSFGAKVLRSSSKPQNGSERIAEALPQIPDIEVIVNLQGDEPFADPNILSELGQIICPYQSPMATVACPILDEELNNPSVVKVVSDQNRQALYFSRAPIPYVRNPEIPPLSQRHLGIYAYHREFLLDYVNWEATPLEQVEMLEQLRVLERGFPIRVLDTERPIGPSIDTEEDYQEALHTLNCCSNLWD